MAASATLPGLILAVAAGLAQYFQARMFSRRQPPKDPKSHLVKGSEDESVAAIMNKQMLYLMPALTVIFATIFRPVWCFIGWYKPFYAYSADIIFPKGRTERVRACVEIKANLVVLTISIFALKEKLLIPPEYFLYEPVCKKSPSLAGLYQRINTPWESG